MKIFSWIRSGIQKSEYKTSPVILSDADIDRVSGGVFAPVPGYGSTTAFYILSGSNVPPPGGLYIANNSRRSSLAYLDQKTPGIYGPGKGQYTADNSFLPKPPSP